MNSDLVHSSSSRPAEDNARSSIEAEPQELRVTILAVGADLADPDLVAHNLDWLLAAHRMSEKHIEC